MLYLSRQDWPETTLSGGLAGGTLAIAWVSEAKTSRGDLGRRW